MIKESLVYGARRRPQLFVKGHGSKWASARQAPPSSVKESLVYGAAAVLRAASEQPPAIAQGLLWQCVMQFGLWRGKPAKTMLFLAGVLPFLLSSNAG